MSPLLIRMCRKSISQSTWMETRTPQRFSGVLHAFETLTLQWIFWLYDILVPLLQYWLTLDYQAFRTLRWRIAWANTGHIYCLLFVSGSAATLDFTVSNLLPPDKKKRFRSSGWCTTVLKEGWHYTARAHSWVSQWESLLSLWGNDKTTEKKPCSSPSCHCLYCVNRNRLSLGWNIACPCCIVMSKHDCMFNFIVINWGLRQEFSSKANPIYLHV